MPASRDDNVHELQRQWYEYTQRTMIEDTMAFMPQLSTIKWWINYDCKLASWYALNGYAHLFERACSN